MCLIAFAIETSARWPLVIAANRDESFSRPALPLASWQTGSGQTIFSGRDLRGGGTWLGATPQGRVAMLTNVRQAENGPGTSSRGELVTRWLDAGLAGELGAEAFSRSIDPAAYGGFNLVIGDMATAQWCWLGNRAFGADGLAFADGQLHQKALAPGVYGLSNAGLDTPWPKTVALAGALREALDAPTLDALTAPLFSALLNRLRSPEADLPRTGVPLSLEEVLSSAYVSDVARGYGTRCSTVLAAARSGQSAALLDVWMGEVTHALAETATPPGRVDAGKAVVTTRWNLPA
ncbi:MAG: NRDE family protein [Comamonadaceae bacterium]|nr:MAG: NRDE family protein [Comamonadaceae bacterium]